MHGLYIFLILEDILRDEGTPRCIDEYTLYLPFSFRGFRQQFFSGDIEMRVLHSPSYDEWEVDCEKFEYEHLIAVITYDGNEIAFDANSQDLDHFKTLLMNKHDL